MIKIAPETSDDYWEVENLYDLCFGPARTSLSSYRLRNGVPPIPRLCQTLRDTHGHLVGAIRFWPIEIGAARTPAALLGPIAVHPTMQGEGLGDTLIRHVLEIANQNGIHRIVLVGDLPYYVRFGFETAPELIFPPPTNPDRVLKLGLQTDSFAGVNGQVLRAKPVATAPNL